MMLGEFDRLDASAMGAAAARCASAVQVLATSLRESRVCLLYCDAGPRRRALIEDALMPLLRHGNAAQRERRVASSPIDFADRRREAWVPQEAGDEAREVVIHFSAWELPPLPVMRILVDGGLPDAWSDEEWARHHGAMNSLGTQRLTPDAGDALASYLAALHQRFGVRFLFVLDDFEEFLAAPPEREDLVQFRREFVDAARLEGLPAHFLIVVREDAAAGLKRLRRRIPGFDAQSYRLYEGDDGTISVVALPQSASDVVRQRTLPQQPVLRAEDVYRMIEEVLSRTARQATAFSRDELGAAAPPQPLLP
jgi:hypothetical protein